MSIAHKKRILVVDDESILRMLLLDVLSEAGYEVDLAENGLDALERLKKDAGYDLLIADMNMPKMDGIDLCRTIREHFPALRQRFLFITGCVTDEAALFLKENNYKHMTKPFKTLDLLNHINNVFAQDATAKKEDVDRRGEERFSWSAYCEIFDSRIYNQTPLLAKTADISQNGVKISYVGEPLAPGDTVSIHIKNLNIQRAAKIIWSKAANEIGSMAGMRLMEPIKIPPTVKTTGP